MTKRVAIIGAAHRFPSAPTSQRFWQALKAGEAMDEARVTVWDKKITDIGVPPGVLTGPSEDTIRDALNMNIGNGI